MQYNESKTNINGYLQKNMSKVDNNKLPNKNSASYDVYNEAWAFVVSIDLVDYKKQIQHYKRWAMIRILQAFTSTTIKIGKTNDNFVDSFVNGDEVILIFKAHSKYIVSSILEKTVIEINSAINYLMPKLLKQNKFDYHFKAGIGCWLSQNNSLILYGQKGSGEKDITLMGDSINYATQLAKIANRNGNPQILFNNLVKINLINEALATYNNYGQHVTYLNNQNILGYSVRFNKYAD